MEHDFSKPPGSMDEVPQDFRGLYEETEDGKVALRQDDSIKSAVSAITGLNKSLKASRAESKALKANRVNLDALADYGDSPDTILEGIQNAVSEAGKGKGKANAEDMQRKLDKIKAELAATHSKELESATKRADALQGQLYNHLVTSTARTALAEAGAIDSDLALPFLQKQVKVVEEDGKFSVHVVDGTGDPRYSGVTGQPMSVNELVAEMKGEEKYGPLFKSDKGSGGGTPADAARRSGQRQIADEDKKPVDKIRAGIEARKRKGRQ
ncbi:MAG: hypothetical protein GY906_28300 [bacterium]|nr:hypothetical protein [bacterium]